MSKRRLFVGGNWKCNGTKKSVSELVIKLNQITIPNNTDVCVSPPYIYLDYVLTNLHPPYLVSAQNVSPYSKGAYTGEVSAEQLNDFNINWTIIGHSERRQLFGATNDIVSKQIKQAVEHELNIILCVGETEAERKENKTMTVITEELNAANGAIASASHNNKNAWEKIVIAYEPIWAIGTGQNATAEQAQEIHSKIRAWIREKTGEETAKNIRIIYGGSVSASNSASLIAQADIDGFLVGGASLKDEFKDIIREAGMKERTSNILT